MQELSKLFGSVERVKVIRFFLANAEAEYDIDEIDAKLHIKKEKLKDELLELEKSSLIIRKKEIFDVQIESKNKIKRGVKEFICYSLNKNFRFLSSLRNFMFDFQNANLGVLEERFKAIGRLKLLLVSGVFVNDDKARVDILYVGESIKEKFRDKLLEDLSIETGVDLKIMILDLEEFEYRYKMYDRFLRDILDGNKNVVVNKMTGYNV